MQIKIHGGTVQNGQSSLCHTCRHSTVVRGARLRNEIVEVRDPRLQPQSGDVPRHDLRRAYVSRQHPSLSDMEEEASILRTNAKRHRVGFVPSKDLKTQRPFRS